MGRIENDAEERERAVRGLLAADLELSLDAQRAAQRRDLPLACRSEHDQDALDGKVTRPGASLVDVERRAAEPECAAGRLLHAGHEALDAHALSGKLLDAVRRAQVALLLKQLTKRKLCGGGGEDQGDHGAGF
jgi:hypothetical protein